MTHLLRATPTLFRVGFADVVAYRAEMAIWVLTATMPLIMLALWNAVASQGPVAGYGQVEMARSPPRSWCGSSPAPGSCGSSTT